QGTTFDDKVVGSGVAVRFADLQALAGGAGHEQHLHSLAALFEVLEIQFLLSHGFGPKTFRKEKRRSYSLRLLLHFKLIYSEYQILQVIGTWFATLYCQQDQQVRGNWSEKGA